MSFEINKIIFAKLTNDDYIKLLTFAAILYTSDSFEFFNYKLNLVVRFSILYMLTNFGTVYKGSLNGQVLESMLTNEDIWNEIISQSDYDVSRVENILIDILKRKRTINAAK